MGLRIPGRSFPLHFQFVCLFCIIHATKFRKFFVCIFP
jgi:hypothetical protein